MTGTQNETGSTRRRILIVDDVSANVHQMMDILRDQYAILAATSGRKALELAVREPCPDLILLDVKMPDMDGHAVLASLKANPATASIPVIFVTSLSEITDEARGLALGAADYITKPVNPDLLRSRVAAQMELARYRQNPIAFELPQHQPGAPKPTILVVDDLPENIHALLDALRTDYTIMVARSGSRALDLMGHEPAPDLVLLDIVMPELDGYEVCRRIKALPGGHNIPVIFISVEDALEEKLRGFEAGASDYVTKPFDVDEVRARVRTHIELSQFRRFLEDLVEQRTAMIEVAEEKYRALFYRDPLTGLANRVLFSEILEHYIAYADRTGGRFALLHIALENLSTINESLGHRLGERVLAEAARRLQGQLPARDDIARVGGHDFGVLLQVDERMTPDFAAQRLIEVLSEPFQLDDHVIYVSANIGIAIFPSDTASGDDMQSCAEAALHEAQTLGRNAMSFFSPDMTRVAKRRLKLESALRGAIKEGGLSLHYQPQIDLTSGELIGLEALVRWTHPELGTVSPGEFIPLAEECGLVIPLGDWVLHEACRQIAAWEREGIAPRVTAVNISAVQLNRGQLLKSVRTALAESGITPDRLELEITESFLMADEASSATSIADLKKMGVRLSIDDFGTGYSSLSYLQQLQVDKLKIDLSFVQSMTTNAGSASIVKAVIALGHSLGLETLAEGVESEGQARYLQSLKCDAIQGFWIARPMPAADITNFIRAFRSPSLEQPGDAPSTVVLMTDDTAIATRLETLLGQQHYRVLVATCGIDALELLASQDASVLITHLGRGEDRAGTQLLEQARAMHPGIVRIALSDHPEITDLTDAINRGRIFKLLFTAWGDAELAHAIRDAFRYHSELSEAGQAPL